MDLNALIRKAIDQGNALSVMYVRTHSRLGDKPKNTPIEIAAKEDKNGLGWRLHAAFNRLGFSDEPLLRTRTHIFSVSKRWAKQHIDPIFMIDAVPGRRDPEDVEAAFKVLRDAGINDVFVFHDFDVCEGYIFFTETDAVVGMALLSDDGFAK